MLPRRAKYSKNTTSVSTTTETIPKFKKQPGCGCVGDDGMNFFCDALQRGGHSVLARDDSGDSVTYEQTLKEATLWREKYGKRKRLCLFTASNTVPVVKSYLACVASGQAALMMNGDASQESKQDLIDRFDPDLTVDGEGHAVDRECSGSPLCDDLSVLLLTSGSTGDPRVAKFSSRQMEANANAIAEYLKLNSDERPCGHLPVSYSYGISILHSHLAVGASIELTNRSLFDSEFWPRFRDDGVTSLSGVPMHYEILRRLHFERMDLPALRSFTQAGGRLDPEIALEFSRLAESKGWSFYIMYGQTEAGPRISYLSPDEIDARPSSIGRPITGVKMHLVGADGHKITGSDETGELVVESPAVMMGYAEKRDDLIGADECHGSLSTGDIAYRDANGYFFIVGRKSRFVKLRGVRVNLDNMEKVLCENFANTVVVGEDDQIWVVLDVETAVEPVKSFINSQFSFSSHDVALVTVPEPPLTDTGKVRLNVLLEQVKSGSKPAK